MTDCSCEQSSRRLTMSAGEMFVYVDSDDDGDDDSVTRRSTSFRRCPVVRPVRGPRRSVLHRSSDSVSPQQRTAPKHFTNGIDQSFSTGGPGSLVLSRVENRFPDQSRI